MPPKNIVIAGGGTGVRALLENLMKCSPDKVDITTITAMSDSGGSTGVLREAEDIQAVGDIRQQLVACMPAAAAAAFERRIPVEGQSTLHPVGNLFLLFLLRATGGDIQAATDMARQLFSLPHKVLPVTQDKIHLHALMSDGQTLNREHLIELEQQKGNFIDRLWLTPECSVNPLAESACEEADLIVLGPGSLYTSVLPVLLVSGVVEAIKASSARVVFVANLATESGVREETACAQADTVNRHLGGRLDAVLCSRSVFPADLLKQYEEERGRKPVAIGNLIPPPYEVLIEDLLELRPISMGAEKLSRPVVRHGLRTAEVLLGMNC